MQARAVRTRLLRCGRPGPSIYLAQSCGNGLDSVVLLLHCAPKYRPVEVEHNAFSPKMIGSFNFLEKCLKKLLHSSQCVVIFQVS